MSSQLGHSDEGQTAPVGDYRLRSDSILGGVLVRAPRGFRLWQPTDPRLLHREENSSNHIWATLYVHDGIV